MSLGPSICQLVHPSICYARLFPHGEIPLYWYLILYSSLPKSIVIPDVGRSVVADDFKKRLQHNIETTKHTQR